MVLFFAIFASMNSRVAFFLDVIASRKSVRSYNGKQISKDELNFVINAGFCSPIGMKSYNNYYITVIQNKELLNKMTEAAATTFKKPSYNFSYKAPTVIVVSTKSISSYVPSIAYADAACIVENMHLAATCIGLGSVFLWWDFISDFASGSSLSELKIPDGFRPILSLAIGHTNEKLIKKNIDKKIPVTVIE